MFHFMLHQEQPDERLLDDTFQNNLYFLVLVDRLYEDGMYLGVVGAPDIGVKLIADEDRISTVGTELLHCG